MRSLDPRINRIQPLESLEPLQQNEEWITWEVFHQKKRGTQVVHVGIVHAPNKDMALVFAKEQFGRRQQCVNLWVAKTSDIYTFNYKDSDMFKNAISDEKKYREASGFTVRDRINKYKKEHGLSNS